MIDLLFHFAGDAILVRVDGTNILFGNTSQGPMMAPLQNLRLSREGVIKEFPDLKDDPEWNEKAVKRFREKIKSLTTESARAKYIIEDLKNYGYIPKYKQIKGHRVEVING